MKSPFNGKFIEFTSFFMERAKKDPLNFLYIYLQCTVASTMGGQTAAELYI